MAALESQLQPLRDEESAEIARLKELIESRTNRQLRKTLIFRNINETKPDEDYAEVKALLARTISENTSISHDTALNSIDRAHREAPKEEGDRQGKRLIYAAFHSWELSQQVIDELRQRCINDRKFKISAEQMYDPMTSRQRNLAFVKRKELKDQGIIVSGYVSFPARLMVNLPGNVGPTGKKIYKLYKNFSSAEV